MSRKQFDITIDAWQNDADKPFLKRIKLSSVKCVLGLNIEADVKRVPIHRDRFCAYASTALTYNRAALNSPAIGDVVSAYAQAALYTAMLENGGDALSPQAEMFDYGHYVSANDTFPVRWDLKQLATPVKNIPAALYNLKHKAAELFTKHLGAEGLASFDQTLKGFFGECRNRHILG